MASLLSLKRVYRPMPDGPIIRRPFFQIGIEFEGVVKNEIYDEFRAHLQDLVPYDIENAQIIFGVDNSVSEVPEGYRPVEIRTTTLPYYAGLRLFEWILCYLYIASQEGDWITNKTCGLHVNVSERDIFTRQRKQIHWYCGILKFFDEHNILRRFGREGSIYCRPIFKPYEERRFDHILDRFKNGNVSPRTEPPLRLEGDKYLSVSLRNSPQHSGYHGPEMRHNRVEFRAIGNTNYHLRFDDLKLTMDHIHDVIRTSYREIAPAVPTELIANE